MCYTTFKAELHPQEIVSEIGNQIGRQGEKLLRPIVSFV